MKTKGVLYVATGEKYRAELIPSAQSMRAANPDLPISVCTDQPIESDLFDQVILLDDATYGWLDKIAGLARTPYDRTLFLDTDTYVTASIPELFDLMDRFDLAVSHAAHSLSISELDVPHSFHELSTGLMVYRRTPEVWQFLQEWRDQYVNFEQDQHSHPILNDQVAFMKVLYASDLRFVTLGPNYHCLAGIGYIWGEAKILHLREEEGIRVRDYAEFLNAELGRRVYIEATNKNTRKRARIGKYKTIRWFDILPIRTRRYMLLISTTSRMTIIGRVLNALKHRGMRESIRVAFSRLK